MGDIILRRAKVDSEDAAVGRQEQFLRVVGVPVGDALDDLVPPLTTSSAIAPRSGAVGSGVTVALMVLPEVV